jgi:predicted metalloendopeptidase
MAKTLSRKEKRKHRSLKNKRTLAPHHNKYEIASNPSTLRIIKKAHRDMEKILKKTDEPLLNRLFRKENIEKLKKMPKDLTDITAYTTTLRKEFASLKKNKEYQPNQDYYDYVNNAWLKEQTDALKKHPTYYVEVDDFRIVQDKVYHEVINYTHDFIKANPASKKANSIKAVTHCIEKASKTKGLQHCQEILKQVTQFIEDEDMYGLLAYSNQDEIFSWQSPIVWSVRPDEKNVKKYISHLSPPQLGLYDYFIYIDDPSDDKKTKEFKSTFRKKYFEFIEKTFKTVLPNDYKDFKAQDVWDVELDLLDAMGCNKIKKEDPDYYNVVTKDELENDYGFNWTFFTEKLGKHTPFPGEYWVGKSGYKTPPKKVVVSSLNALQCTTELLKRKWSSKKWKTYWLFMFYKQMLRFQWDWNEVYYNFYGKFVKGQQVRFPREIYNIFPLSFCYNTFLTEQYVAHNNNPLLEAYVKNMVDDLKHIFIKRIEKNTWLSPSTKKAALAKLHKLEVIVGTPTNLRQDPVLDYKTDDPWYNMALLAGWKRTQFINLEGQDVIDIPDIDV